MSDQPERQANSDVETEVRSDVSRAVGPRIRDAEYTVRDEPEGEAPEGTQPTGDQPDGDQPEGNLYERARDHLRQTNKPWAFYLGLACLVAAIPATCRVVEGLSPRRARAAVVEKTGNYIYQNGDGSENLRLEGVVDNYIEWLKAADPQFNKAEELALRQAMDASDKEGLDGIVTPNGYSATVQLDLPRRVKRGVKGAAYVPTSGASIR